MTKNLMEEWTFSHHFTDAGAFVQCVYTNRHNQTTLNVYNTLGDAHAFNGEGQYLGSIPTRLEYKV